MITTGDFYATWAVELAVHHLDLELELIMEPPDTGAALDLARQTVEELAGGPFPPGPAAYRGDLDRHRSPARPRLDSGSPG